MEEQDFSFFLERHSRHVLLNSIGLEGTKKLSQSKILLIGLGGLGSPLLYYLAACGTGLLGIADFDSIENSNLARQIIYEESDLGKFKTDVAREKINKVNRSVQTIIYKKKILSNDLEEIIPDYDLVIDAVDLTKTKWMIHDVCLSQGKTLIHAGVIGFQGQILTIIPNHTACLRCFFPDPDLEDERNCTDEGVLSPLCGVVGSLQAAEAIRYLTADETSQNELSHINRLLQIDLSRGRFKNIPALYSSCSHASLN